MNMILFYTTMEVYTIIGIVPFNRIVVFANILMVVNPQHYRRLTLKQTMDAENVLLEQDKVIDFPLKPSDLSKYDEVLYE